MTEAGLSLRGWRWLAGGWLLLVALLALHQFSFWRAPRLDTDLLALLPQDERSPELARATQQLSEQAARQVVVLLGAADWPSAQAAADRYLASLDAEQAPLALQRMDADAQAAMLAFYRPYRDRLLTPAQRARLRDMPPAALAADAGSRLLQPGPGLRLSDWPSDPLGLWPEWWLARAAETGAQPRDGRLWRQAEGRDWLVLPLTATGAAFAIDGQRSAALARAEAAAREAVPELRVLMAGVPLHADAAAEQAQREVSIIGLGSLAAVLLLVWAAFRSLKPILLVALSLAIGCAAALSVTALLFERVHLLTLVFGASLVGVAEDYGIHYFATRQQHAAQDRYQLLRGLLPGLLLAFLTSALAYLALGLAPFPGLRQMAVFSAVGLAAAFLTVLCWFPALDGARPPAPSAFSAAVAGSLARWPRLQRDRRWGIGLGLGVIFMFAGLAQLRIDDDIRTLQNTPPALAQMQRDATRLLGLPSPAQFFLVRGATPEQLLQREEALKARLQPLLADGTLGGYRALSDWVPSARQQAEDAALSGAVESGVLAEVGAQLGESLSRPPFAAEPLTVEAWLRGPAAAGAGALWLGPIGDGYASVVTLAGLADPRALPRFAALADGLEGVRWVDRASDISTLLARYRMMMAALLALGYLAVAAAVWRRYRHEAWRVMLPTLLATALSLACLGWMGQPLQLFNVLALMLLLGIGVDYGIFLQEHRGDGAAWLSVSLGAASTLLSFGLLGLSATPALQAFGRTLLFGIGLVWLISPVFFPRAAPAGVLPDPVTRLPKPEST